MTTFREGDTIEIPYALLDADGNAVTAGAGDTLKLLIMRKYGRVAEHAFTWGEDAEIEEEQVTLPDPDDPASEITVEGYLFTSAELAAGSWVYEWQYEADGGASDTERGAFKVERKIEESEESE